MHDARQRPHLFDRIIGLVLDGALRPLADDEMRLDVGPLQRFEKAHAEDGAGRAGHADDEASHRKSFRNPAGPPKAFRVSVLKSGYHFGQFWNKCPNLRIARALSSGDGAFTSGNWSFQWNGRQASITARLLV